MNNTLFTGTISSFTFLATIVGVSLITPLFIFGVTLGLTLVIPNFILDTTFLTLYFVIACTLYNLFLMLMIGTGHIEDGENVGHYFSILVPANNEEDVIEETLEHILKMDYPSELFEVIVINDGSIDNTEKIVQDLQYNYSHLKLINITPNNGGRGKSLALNTAFADFLLTWRGIEIRPKHRWIIGVFDSDSTPDYNMLKKVSFQFNDPKVGGVQTLVRIKNRKKSFLAKLQDIEFLTFSKVVQFARAIFKGSVALGGNGQFIRATALETVAIKDQEEYWRNDTLTEDLDMGVRLITKKWENRYIDSTSVHQEGPETFSALFFQRERWSWGTLQTLVRYVISLKFWKNRIHWKKKVDVMVYLFNIMIPSLVLICWIWTALSISGIISINNMFPPAFCLANGFSFFPLMGFSLWKERNEYPLWQMIPLLFIASVYTYHWIPCTSSAIIKSIAKKPSWKKTPRFNNTKKTCINERPLKREEKPQIITNI
jgi:1,2-diacylglycerol 3-beta-glucosyltransferase